MTADSYQDRLQGSTLPLNAAARRLDVHGAVQGVGFRPYVVRLARELGLNGWVRNAGGHVIIEAAGTPESLNALAARLPAEAPAQAVVRDVIVTDLDDRMARLHGRRGFTVGASIARSGRRDFPPDLAACEECLRELFDPADRRYRYPFVNCTACGPRATIITELPYDRPQTTMAPFPLCAACAAEYTDPADRRFHAEPVACPACGPTLRWATSCDTSDSNESTASGDDALTAAVGTIASGGIVAVKGLGGYQLVCDATRTDTVARLRAGKHRPAKPLAVMVADVAAARQLARVSDVEAELLTSVARPIVLLARQGDRHALAAGIHPQLDEVGLFLPYTPLHHLLLHDLARPLVVTSGNRSGEPIIIDDHEARTRLGQVADAFLTHDRRIRARYDDSVARVVAGTGSVVRRARGYAPAPTPLPRPAPRPLLAVGAQLKHTFALASADDAIVSPHIGDLSNQDTFTAFTDGLAHLSTLLSIRPTCVAHDLHPAYISTQYAARWPRNRRLPVQHHHAHVASCAAEHGVTEPFIGVAYDGLGWGDDGTLWGGEVFLADLTAYRRVGRFGTAPLPGGELAVRRPARMAMGYLFGGERIGAGMVDPELAASFAGRFDEQEVATVRRMIDRHVNSPYASSAGRLFDAAASILGLCDDVSYEGEAAIVLEATAGGSGGRPVDTGELPWKVVSSSGMWVYDPAPTLMGLLRGVTDGTPVHRLAASFHATVTAVTLALCIRAAQLSKVSTVCLSGGVFQNRRLVTELRAALGDEGFTVYVNETVPANDGGISYGQAAVASARMNL
ncbi:carbamoyltransferase HypF [Phytoactinopolyspora halotolerans]|uniref:Carbamoyltransferase n=1 Tax=Phytoactinopolyspora halotolerans TaxID=1981512 RepID=A0A6L9S6K2_9ACTN|nr:carbamoyltransferase HypF [Phytoactinopolyspora halotolerans]NEE00647.1 carbamoyltransferase HypF [Phytoactinopolyspora halotolerans]